MLSDGGAVASVHRRRAFIVVLMIDGMLILLHLVSQWMEFHGEDVLGGSIRGHTLLNLDQEVSIPTWWQQSKLLSASGICLLLHVVRRRPDTGEHAYWFGLAGIFLFISVDEGAEIHEYLTEPMRSAFDIEGGLLWFAWVIPGLAALTVFGVVFARFWYRLPDGPRALMAAGGAIFVLGGALFESIGGAHEQTHGQDFGYFLAVAAEEGLEMIGATVFVLSVLTMVQLSQPASGVVLRVEG